jgi:Fe2+ or Zn2+ uptake regulation protein
MWSQRGDIPNLRVRCYSVQVFIDRTFGPEPEIWTRSRNRALESVSLSTEDELLRGAGLHVTAQRVAVLRAVAAHPHSTADDIEQHVREQLGSVSHQAVYDVLNVLSDHELVRRIQPAGSPARYEDRVGDNHHHLICRTCRRMVDVDCAVGYTPCLTAADGMAFEIDEAEVIYWGRCPECVTAAAKQRS